MLIARAIMIRPDLATALFECDLYPSGPSQTQGRSSTRFGGGELVMILVPLVLVVKGRER